MSKEKSMTFPFLEEDAWKKDRLERDRLMLLQRINYERYLMIKDTYERIKSGRPLNTES